MTSRIEVINDALVLTGNSQVAVEFDGSDEWTVAYTGYRRGVGILLERGVFNFSTATAALARTGGAPAGYERWDNAFAMPAGCLKIRGVKDSNDVDIPYLIVDNEILCRTDDPIAVYVREPAQNAWPHLFVEALKLHVEAAVLRGLNEDHDAADKRERRADAMFDTAHTKSDQQTPGRVFFAGRIMNRRRGRTYRGL